MSFAKINNVNILGIASAVPKQISINTNPKFISTTGIHEKRIVENNTCTSDLCLEAAEQLLKDLNIIKQDIDVLVFVSQTPDYKAPVTSTILQHKLNLPQTCVCIDIPLGCSGYVYGLYVISSLINTTGKKGLLLVGDTISKEVDKNDTGAEPLFGDAGTATLLDFNTNSNPMYFDLGSDGEGYESIIIPKGGSRNKYNDVSETLLLNGIDVFQFGINKIPKIVNNFLEKLNITVSSFDCFVFHQANQMMLDKIYKKLNIDKNKTLHSLNKFGNTSSATIPLTLVTNMNSIKKESNLMICGFGIGLSWGVSYIKPIEDIYCCKLIEI
jgi:3-oxoacyl-[acyl-carrier-protein] synthase-3